MTRIVGGQARGRRLEVPARGVRPTSDRVREALFNTLAGLLDLSGARVLDLFAGSGAIGLEALSRGASQAVLVDSAHEAGQALRRNVDAVALSGAVIRSQSVESYLLRSGSDGPGSDGPDSGFDFVFADPPYAFGSAELGAVLEQLIPWTVDGTVVVVERSARDAAPMWPNVIEPIKDRRYGDSVLWYGRREVAGSFAEGG